jgi:hypothetical protein
MFKKLAIAGSLAFALTAVPNVSRADAPASVLTSISCASYINSIFVNIFPTACSGVWDGNEVSGPALSTTGTPSPLSAVQGMGLVGNVYIEKLSGLGGSNTIDFSTTLVGNTIIGIHWGGGVFKSDVFKNVTTPNNATIFFAFNAGTGLDKIILTDEWAKGSSNAGLYKTGTLCTENCGPGPRSTVPEPSTYALMTAGLLGIFGVARRRRNAKV